MIQPNVRASFGRREAQLLVSVAGAEGETRLREAGIDALLDDPGLLRSLLRRRGVHLPAPLLFYLLVRHALLEREINDRRLADYTAAVLLAFGKLGPTPEPESGPYLADVLAELERAHGEREFQLRAHLGNLALWLAGIFPDHITHRVQRRGAPPLSYYDAMGAAGFRGAAGMDLALRHGLGDLFVRAADGFTEIRSALNELSDLFFFPERGDPVERVLRQVADRFERARQGRP